MIGRNFIVKSENFFEHSPKNSSENSIPLPINRKKYENISLSYDVNDQHVYSISKSV